MACFAEEPLTRVEGEEQAQRLLQALHKDMPHSVHVINSVENVLEWGRTGMLDMDFEPAMRHAIYRYKGDGDSGDGDATVVTITKVGEYYWVVCIHTTDPACTALRRVLADSALLPWGGDTMFESVHERCLPALLEQVRARGDLAPGLYPTDKMFLPRKEALKLLDVSCPPGYVLLPLMAKHSGAVDATWVGFGLGSREMIESIIVRTQGLSWGVFPEDKTGGNDPAAHILGEGGYLRCLYTSDGHRRKGLGSLVTRVTCKAMAERGKDIHGNIEFPNPASEATFLKLGFKRICECTYVIYHTPRAPQP